MTPLFPAERLSHVLGAVVADAGMTQLRIAETEKYAHVTFFLNGGEETLFPGEERILVPSPKVATYDLQPEMSAFEVTDKLVDAIRAGKFDLIVVNYANTDMVGHTGDLQAAMKAVETVDTCLGRLCDAVAAQGGAMLITADHGNAETMQDPETARAAHRPHAEPRAGDPGQWRGGGAQTARRPPGRYRADAAGADGTAPARGDDRAVADSGRRRRGARRGSRTACVGLMPGPWPASLPPERSRWR